MRLRNIKILPLLAILLVAQLAKAQNSENVSNWPQGVTYEIFVQSFADSDGDGIGDFNGMTSKLDYLEDLGIEGIWLMPINPSNSYHKYNVEDYYDVHPDYGTLDDFKNFVSEAHKRGIKVIMDLVINHTGDKNIWFQEALKGPDNKYWDYFVWEHKDNPNLQPVLSEDGSQQRMPRNWNSVEGSDYLYFSHFTPNMPDLNYDNPMVKQEMFKVGRFWLQDVGVDGFRLDAAMHVFPEDRATDSHAWWEYFLQEMKKVKEDVYIVGEVWANSERVAPFLNGIPALFNFDMGTEIIKAVNEVNAENLTSKHSSIIEFYKSVNPEYIDCTFLTNHDQDRILSSVGNDIDKAQIAASLLFTLSGSPYIYYGEEIGMLGVKPDQYIREPFLWDKASKDKFRTSWIEPRSSDETTVTPMKAQQKDDDSILNHYKSLIKLRNQSSALTFGNLEPLSISDSEICLFVRTDENESLLVIHNLSNESKEISLPADVQVYSELYFSDNGAENSGAQISLPGYSTIILNK